MAAPKTWVSGEAITAADLNTVSTVAGNSGMVWIGTYTSSAARPFKIDNVFTSTYDNYRIVGKVRSTVNTNNLYFQLLDSSGNAITTNYYSTMYGLDFQNAGTTFTTLSLTTVGYVGWMPNSTTAYLVFTIDIFGPAISGDQTSWTVAHTGLSSGSAYLGGHAYGIRNVAAAERGLQFDNGGAGNITGSVTVYGYRKS